MPLVSVTMARGRTPEQKSKMLLAIADAIHDSIGAPRESIRVWINEVENTDFLAGTEVLVDKQRRLAAEAAESRPSDTTEVTEANEANEVTET